MGLFTRSIRPPSEPNPDNTDTAPGTVGPTTATAGDPNGVEVTGSDLPPWWPPAIVPSAWSGWPAEWLTPAWGGQLGALTDTAWAAIDLNSSLLATMPPYLVGAASTLDAAWMTNPDPDLTTSWEEFAKQLFWDFQACGEVFVIATARYASGFPARFHVVSGAYVTAEIDQGQRRYSIGGEDVTADMLHIRYTSRVGDAHGVGPLEVGRARMVQAAVLSRYASEFAASGGIPASVITHPEELTKQQASDLQAQWVNARISRIGQPAVLSGGVGFQTVQASPKDAALVELSQLSDSRICVLLGVPPFLMGLPAGGDSLTYSNVNQLFSFHWRAGLRPKASIVMQALSGWLLPRGTGIEVNRDAYVQPEPLERAQTYAALHAIQDASGPAISVEEIRRIERFPPAAAGLNLPGGTL